MPKLRVLKLAGSPYEMGYAHGQAYYDDIHHAARDRLRLSSDAHWTGFNLSEAEILELAESCIPAHEVYAPDLMEELRGMAAATGLSLAELIIVNGFTDFIDLVYAYGLQTQTALATQAADNCTAFLVPNQQAEQGKGFFGQTWDMHASATPYVILMDGQPDQGPRFLNFTMTGCVGMIGMNEAGIAVGINNILGGDGQVGVMWNFVVRKALMQDNIDDALACITDVPRAGAHNYLLMDREGSGYNIEAMGQREEVETLGDAAIVHTNHCLVPRMHEVERERAPASLEHSQHRLQRATTLLSDKDALDVDDLMALTRDREAICVTETAPMHVETSGAAIMRPASGDFWAVWGRPTEGDYEHFTV